jgi:purine-binding chemotaxis protein CheW
MTLESLPNLGDELVTVAVGEQQFAIDIMSVREIRGWTRSTPLPNAAAHFLGMINLRGVILPVIDLRACLGLGATEVARSSVVVVVQSGERQVGLLVDGVCDILRVTDGLIQPPPDMGSDGAQDLVSGVMTTDQGIISLLALAHIVGVDEEHTQAA